MLCVLGAAAVGLMLAVGASAAVLGDGHGAGGGDDGFRPGNLVVSRSVYDNSPANVQVGETLPPGCTSAAERRGRTGHIRSYDSYKVQAVLDEIAGYDHSGTTRVGVPAIFGMNFQTVSTAEKLPVSDGLAGGYLADGETPGPLLSRALDYVNQKIGAMVDAIREHGLDALHRDHPVGEARPVAADTVRAHPHPGRPDHECARRRVGDDAPDRAAARRLLGQRRRHAHLAERPLAGRRGIRQELPARPLGIGNDITGATKPYTSSGLRQVYAGADAAAFLGVPFSDPRVPDVIGIAQVGTVYTGGQGKIAEHGGDNPQDRDVPIVVSGDPVEANGNVDRPVETTQIAPTILRLLGLDPDASKAVQIEHTETLPLH